MMNLDVTKRKPPYGVWINVKTGEKRYYDEQKNFYDNTAEIDLLQEELKQEDFLIEESIREQVI